MKYDIMDKLKSHYDFIEHNINFPEKVIDKYFGIDDIYEYINEINEAMFVDKFLNIDDGEDGKYDIFEFEDFYDFTDTYLGVDSTDIIIFFKNDEDVYTVFIIQLIRLLNKIFKNWVLSRSSGFRKNTKLYLEMLQDYKIKLIYEPDLRVF